MRRLPAGQPRPLSPGPARPRGRRRVPARARRLAPGAAQRRRIHPCHGRTSARVAVAGASGAGAGVRGGARGHEAPTSSRAHLLPPGRVGRCPTTRATRTRRSANRFSRGDPPPMQSRPRARGPGRDDRLCAGAGGPGHRQAREAPGEPEARRTSAAPGRRGGRSPRRVRWRDRLAAVPPRAGRGSGATGRAPLRPTAPSSHVSISWSSTRIRSMSSTELSTARKGDIAPISGASGVWPVRRTSGGDSRWTTLSTTRRWPCTRSMPRWRVRTSRSG